MEKPTYLIVGGHIPGVSTIIAKELAKKQGSPDITVVAAEEMEMHDIKTARPELTLEMMTVNADYKGARIYLDPKNYLNGRILPKRKK